MASLLGCGDGNGRRGEAFALDLRRVALGAQAVLDALDAPVGRDAGAQSDGQPASAASRGSPGRLKLSSPWPRHPVFLRVATAALASASVAWT